MPACTALGQVAHVDVEKEIDRARGCATRINFHLKPAPIAVLAAEVAAPDFHARFSAIGRAYLYRIVNRRAPLTVDRSRAWRVATSLDANRDARRRAGAGRQARLHHVPRHPLPGEIAGEDAGAPRACIASARRSR